MSLPPAAGAVSAASRTTDSPTVSGSAVAAGSEVAAAAVVVPAAAAEGVGESAAKVAVNLKSTAKTAAEAVADPGAGEPVRERRWGAAAG